MFPTICLRSSSFDNLGIFFLVSWFSSVKFDPGIQPKIFIKIIFFFIYFIQNIRQKNLFWTTIDAYICYNLFIPFLFLANTTLFSLFEAYCSAPFHIYKGFEVIFIFFSSSLLFIFNYKVFNSKIQRNHFFNLFRFIFIICPDSDYLNVTFAAFIIF